MAATPGSPAPRPEREDAQTVCIIGAGIVGVSAALWLLRDGHRVLLIDRAGPGEGASHGNGGVLAACSVVPVTMPGLVAKAPRMLLDPDAPLFLRWAYLPRLAPWLLRYLSHANASDAARIARALFPLVGDSLADHQALSAGTPAARYLRPSDYLYLYESAGQYAADRAAWDLRRAAGFEWEVWDRAALDAYDPVFSPSLGCAVRLGDHGRIGDPGAYVKALAGHAETLGARILRAEVTGLALEGDRVAGVRAGGETLPCDAALLATGAWSRRLLGDLGLSVPLETERGYHLELWEPSVMPRAPVMFAGAKFVATPMEGRLRLAGIVEFGGLSAPASPAPFALLRRRIRAAMPDLRWRHEVEWMGHRPAPSDSIPLIGAVPGRRGLWLGCGHHHVGLTGGPRTGRLLAQMIAGLTPNIDVTPYSPARFAKAA